MRAIISISVPSVFWLSAALTLCFRLHLQYQCDILRHLPSQPWPTAVLTAAGTLIAFGLWKLHRRPNAPPSQQSEANQASLWLGAVGIIPVIELSRLCGAEIPLSIFEPLVLVICTFQGVKILAEQSFPIGHGKPPRRAIPWFAIIVAVTMALAAWWYAQAEDAYANYTLGFNDFADYANRLANTWEGRGFMRISPAHPAFGDHFNPSLGLLSPIWGIWPDPRSFLAIHAFALALPAIFIYGLARQFGCLQAGAAAWAGAYLAHPAVGPMNLSFSYGGHPATFAMAAFLGAAYALAAKRRKTALVLALLACGFQETEFVAPICLAIALAIFHRKNDADPFASGLPRKGWIAVSACALLLFLLVLHMTRLGSYATSYRFSHLGNTPLEVLASPLTNPAEFWGALAVPQSLVFMLALVATLGAGTVAAGWPIWLAVLPPLITLLVMKGECAGMLGLQYPASLLPALFLAALRGAAGEKLPDERQTRLHSHGIAALLAGVVASVYIGALPFSRPTNTLTPDAEMLPEILLNFQQKKQVLDEVSNTIRATPGPVLASGRIAAHLIGIPGLEFAGLVNSPAFFDSPAKDKATALRKYDWLALDLSDGFQQSTKFLVRLAREASAAGFLQISPNPNALLFLNPDRKISLHKEAVNSR